ncbi:MAG: hypothetical protein AAFO09_08230 [Pseudomonadota bacterium]
MILVVVYIFKDRGNIELVRIISARKATRIKSKEYRKRHP